MIVPYREEYRAPVIDLVLHIQNEEYGLAISLEEQPDLLVIEREYVQPGGGFWLALNERGEVVGTIGLQVRDGHGIMKKFFVHTDHRGRAQGVAAALYDALLKHARGAGLQSIILDTPSVAERSHAFYRRAGFREITAAELPIAYRYPDRNSLLFQLELPASAGWSTSTPAAEPMDRSRTRTFTWQDPLIGARSAQTLSGLAYLQAMQQGELPMAPMLATLGIGAGEFEKGRAVFWADPEEYHYNPIGVVHGGLASTLCDSAMACAVHSTLPAGAGYTTLELKVNFVRPLTADVGRVTCEGRVVHVGGRVVTAESRVTDAGGRLYAHATTTCMVFRPDRGTSS